MIKQYHLSLKTSGRGFNNITEEIKTCVTKSQVKLGLCHIFLSHTSASLILCENADPSVQRDLEAFMQQWIPDGDLRFTHTAEGPDDMPSHIRSVLTTNSLTIPITDRHLALGTWQGIYLWEHRFRSHERHYVITIQGEE